MVPLRPLVEVCLESVAGCRAAEAAGAGRVELCSALVEGGLTPSRGLQRQARRACSLPVFCMIRPRGGDFLYDEDEYAAMLEDVRGAREAGMDGVVFGLLQADGRVDRERTARLAEAARPLEVTFHRAFDVCRDPFEALETLAGIGVERVLTSGQEAGVEEGLPLLRELRERARGRLGILPGCGITLENAARIVAALEPEEIHLAAGRRRPSPMRFRNPRCRMAAHDPPGEYERVETDPAVLEALRRALDGEPA